MTIRLTSADADETFRIAGTFASGLAPGDVVLLSGDLGAGKTTFVRGAARRLGYGGPVSSPTFTIGRIYDSSPPLAHLDLYRLAGGNAGAEDPGLLDEYLHPSRIAFIEWPTADPMLIADLEADGRRVLRVAVEHGGGDRRFIELPQEVAG